jgi:hypothetical protein
MVVEVVGLKSKASQKNQETLSEKLKQKKLVE